MGGSRGITGLIVSLLICFFAAGLGTVATAPQINDWYATLSKPAWTPPNEIFGPVWSLLYALMAVAVWLVWRRNSAGQATIPLLLFAFQLAANVAWSWLFFGLENPLLGLLDIGLLCIAVVLTVAAFWRVSRPAAILLLPYLVWILFAALLNFSIWRLNA